MLNSQHFRPAAGCDAGAMARGKSAGCRTQGGSRLVCAVVVSYGGEAEGTPIVCYTTKFPLKRKTSRAQTPQTEQKIFKVAHSEPTGKHCGCEHDLQHQTKSPLSYLSAL